jgi:hypothetical protein
MENFRAKFTPPNNDHSYYPLLYLALQTTKQGGVIEMGTGHGSTKLLHDYCLVKGRNLYSYDEKEEWGSKFYDLRTDKHLVEVVSDWDSVCYTHKDSDVSVVFIDHAPGERRKEDILNFKDINGILVCHDTEPAADYGYQMRQHFSKFKYVVEVQTNGAWATALSNTIDITKWDGQKFSEYVCTKD